MIWAHYILQVNIYLTLFYCFYRLLLARETFFLFNRIYLVGSGILSLAIPFLKFEWFARQEATQQISAGVGQITSIVQQITFSPVQESGFNWGKLIVLIYLSGVVLYVIKLLFQAVQLKKIFSGISNGQAFSFFNKKVVDPALPSGDIINRHEDIHIKELHTVDLIFFELLTVFIWFNPVIYLYKRTIRSIHEYLADEKAAAFQGNKEEYALLLLSSAFKIEPHLLTNNFFSKSLIKRRIFMLHKQRSAKTAILKYGLFVPLFAATLLLSSATIRENNEIKAVAERFPITEVVLAPIESVTATIADNHVPLNISLRISDIDGLRKYLVKAVKYPAEAVEKNIQGNTLIKFSVKDGQVSDVGTSKTLGEGCDAEAMKAILGYTGFKNVADGKYTVVFQFRLSSSDAEILNNETESIQGYQKIGDIVVVGNKQKATGEVTVIGYPGNSVRIRGAKSPNGALYVVDGQEQNDVDNIDLDNIQDVSVIPGPAAMIKYGDKGRNGVIVINLKNQEETNEVKDYVSVEVQPQFPGGIEKFRQYISSNLKYPKAALDAGLQGTVYVSFIVEKDGAISNVKVDRTLGGGLDEEAMRVISESKKWNPGLINGKPVIVKYNFPVQFLLSKK